MQPIGWRSEGRGSNLNTFNPWLPQNSQKKDSIQDSKCLSWLISVNAQAKKKKIEELLDLGMTFSFNIWRYSFYIYFTGLWPHTYTFLITKSINYHSRQPCGNKKCHWIDVKDLLIQFWPPFLPKGQGGKPVWLKTDLNTQTQIKLDPQNCNFPWQSLI